jgi:hypothetical protein
MDVLSIEYRRSALLATTASLFHHVNPKALIDEAQSFAWCLVGGKFSVHFLER